MSYADPPGAEPAVGDLVVLDMPSFSVELLQVTYVSPCGGFIDTDPVKPRPYDRTKTGGGAVGCFRLHERAPE